MQSPSRSLLQRTDPIFGAQTHGVATIGPIPALDASQFVGLTIQNPTQGQVSVTFRNNTSGVSNTMVLPSGGRAMDDIAAFLGAAPAAGDTITVTSTSGIQIVGLNGDETLGTVTAFVPVF
jgi:hypothetical protein